MADTIGIAMLIVDGLGFFIFLIGFATPSWYEAYIDIEIGHVRARRGLWQTCLGDGCDTLTLEAKHHEDWFDAVRVFVCFGLVCYIMLSIFVVATVISKHQRVLLITRIIGLITFVFIFIGVVTYGAKQKTDLHYSYILTVVGSFGSIIVSGLTFAAKYEKPRSNSGASETKYEQPRGTPIGLEA